MSLDASKLPEFCEAAIIFDPSGDNVELTPYLGGIRFKSEQEVQDVKQSGYGNTPVDKFTSGKIGNVIEFAATRAALARILNLIYGAVAGTATASTEAVVGNKSGNSFIADAKLVYIKPIVDDVISTTQSEWIQIYACGKPREIMDLPFQIDEQQAIAVEMPFFPDRTTGNVGKLYSIGVD